jgi:hypothetical protein
MTLLFLFLISMFLTQQGYSLNPDLEEKQQSHITNAPNTRAKTEVYFIETTECADALDTQNSRQGDILIRKQLKYSLNKFANRYSSDHSLIQNNLSTLEQQINTGKYQGLLLQKQSEFLQNAQSAIGVKMESLEKKQFSIIIAGLTLVIGSLATLTVSIYHSSKHGKY